MYGTLRLIEPAECTGHELRAFEGLVRRGFAGSDDTLSTRIADARWLAFQFSTEDQLLAIAGLKQPGEQYTRRIFTDAEADVDPGEYDLELGWVFVIPTHRDRGVASALCNCLVRRVSPSPVFATTKPDNAAMIRILSALGFQRRGGPLFRRGQKLVLFLRSRPQHAGFRTPR